MCEILATELKKRGERCRCIRCREVGLKKTGHDKAVLIERTYESSGGMEYFLSFESPDEHTIYGFVRLRLSPSNKNFTRKHGEARKLCKKKITTLF